MKKEQIELCKQILSLFNDAEFNVKGSKLILSAQLISAFGKMIMDANDKLDKPIQLLEQEKPIKKKGKKK